jgi:hypothetical protein
MDALNLDPCYLCTVRCYMSYKLDTTLWFCLRLLSLLHFECDSVCFIYVSKV